MEYSYHKHRSLIMDQLYFPMMLESEYDQILDDLTSQEREQLADVLAVSKEFEQLLAPYRKRIEVNFFQKNVTNLPSILYQKLLEAGEEPETFDDLLALFGQLPIDIIHKSILNFIGKGETQYPLSDKELFELLDEGEMKNEMRWRLLWAYHHPKELVSQLIELYQEIIPLYQPYLAQYEAECDQFAQNLDIAAIFKESQIDLMGMLLSTQRELCHLFVLSPWYLFNVFSYDEDRADSAIYFYTHPRVKVLINSRLKMTDESLTIMLKTLGDENRYQVLRELVKEDAKSKVIAEKLGITAANVSFHTQKLLNAQLLLFNTEAKGNKYKLNKPVIKLLLERLSQDFDV